MRIREGDPLEIFTDRDGEVIFKKYSPIGELSGFASQYAETLYRTCNFPILICDRDSVIAASGTFRRELDGKPISAELDNAMQSRQVQQSQRGIPVCAAVPGAEAVMVAPVISGGDLCGCAALLGSDSPVSDSDGKLLQAAALFFARQMEG